MTENSESIEEIRRLTSAFNKGYAIRDLSALDDFMRLFAEDENLEFIGIGGMFPGRGTWRLGREAVRDLFRADWEYWGSVQLDEEKARITVRDDLAWLSTSAAITTDDETEEFLGDKQEMMGSVHQSSIDDSRIKPLRVTAVLMKQENHWRFLQIHMSFSIRSLPK
ncbi:hypothetical protein ANAEL_01726 [Anaerolineales bacterium]|nr:hypothetical protein ANAEL_01726 [Anaerolineales bacterium]